jgi:hypothetical protein
VNNFFFETQQLVNEAANVLNLDHVEFFLACAAIRATPGQRHVFPLRARRYTGCGVAFFFFIDIAANYAQVRFHLVTTAKPVVSGGSD